MPAIALYTESKSLLCFMLVSRNESIAEGGNKRDCILTCPPAQVVDQEHPLSIARTEFLHVEHKAIKEEKKEGLEIMVRVADLGTLTLKLDEDEGTWTYSGDFGIREGLCKIAKSKRD